MSRVLCCTADLAPGSLTQRIRIRQLEAAHQTGTALAGLVCVAALLIAAGKTFGILISNSDSAAPAGVIASSPQTSGVAIWLRPACRLQSRRPGSRAAICAPGHAPALPNRLASSRAHCRAT